MNCSFINSSTFNSVTSFEKGWNIPIRIGILALGIIAGAALILNGFGWGIGLSIPAATLFLTFGIPCLKSICQKKPTVIVAQDKNLSLEKAFFKYRVSLSDEERESYKKIIISLLEQNTPLASEKLERYLPFVIHLCLEQGLQSPLLEIKKMPSEKLIALYDDAFMLAGYLNFKEVIRFLLKAMQEDTKFFHDNLFHFMNFHNGFSSEDFDKHILKLIMEFISYDNAYNAQYLKCLELIYEQYGHESLLLFLNKMGESFFQKIPTARFKELDPEDQVSEQIIAHYL